jgi:hypothetical protein
VGDVGEYCSCGTASTGSIGLNQVAFISLETIFNIRQPSWAAFNYPVFPVVHIGISLAHHNDNLF